jgi:WD40 repeat protein
MHGASNRRAKIQATVRVAIVFGLVAVPPSAVAARGGGAAGASGRIAFVRATGNTTDVAHIFVMNPDGSGVRQLTDGQSWDFGQSWSPDGRTLAYARR